MQPTRADPGVRQRKRNLLEPAVLRMSSRIPPDYYLTGTTMHAMPGLAILPSRDPTASESLRMAVLSRADDATIESASADVDD